MKTPREYQQVIDDTTAAWALASEQYETIIERRPALWMALRESTNSDKAADRAYEATEDGKAEALLRLRMKRYEKESSAAKSALRVLDAEARNLV
jgi:hypothetical protein